MKTTAPTNPDKYDIRVSILCDDPIFAGFTIEEPAESAADVERLRARGLRPTAVITRYYPKRFDNPRPSHRTIVAV